MDDENFHFDDKIVIQEPKNEATEIIAYITTIGFFLILGYTVVKGLPKDDANVFLILLGALAQAWGGGVVGYYFGASHVKKEPPK